MTIPQGLSVAVDRRTDKISQQPENCENRNDPDMVQAFLKEWWVESDFKAPNLPHIFTKLKEHSWDP
jgi:hypothetical protein